MSTLASDFRVSSHLHWRVKEHLRKQLKMNPSEQKTSSVLSRRSELLSHPFSSMNLAEFTECFKREKQWLFADARTSLLKAVPELAKSSSCCVLTTGSDGRGENFHTLSLMELIFVIKEESEESLFIKDKLQKFVKQHPELFFNFLEVQNLAEIHNQPSLKVGVTVSPLTQQIAPSRPLDAAFVVGKRKVKQLYDEQFLSELTLERLSEFYKKFVKPAFSVLSSFLESKNAQKFGVYNDHLLFNGKKMQPSKYLLLRPVQYTLDLLILKYIRLKVLPENFLTKNAQVDKRIRVLARLKLLPLDSKEKTSLEKAYLKALAWHLENHRLSHLSEAVPCAVINLKVDQREFDDCAESIYYMCNKLRKSAIVYELL